MLTDIDNAAAMLTVVASLSVKVSLFMLLKVSSEVNSIASIWSVGEYVVGLAVGLLGIAVGRNDGTMVGVAEGDGVGFIVGERVGRLEGCLVGMRVGCKVGGGVGCVGDAVVVAVVGRHLQTHGVQGGFKSGLLYLFEGFLLDRADGAGQTVLRGLSLQDVTVLHQLVAVGVYLGNLQRKVIN